MAEAHSLGYEPQSPMKKLAPWGAGTERRVVTVNELEERIWQDLERNMLGCDDDVGHYDYCDDYDDWSTYAADGAFCP